MVSFDILPPSDNVVYINNRGTSIAKTTTMPAAVHTWNLDGDSALDNAELALKRSIRMAQGP